MDAHAPAKAPSARALWRSLEDLAAQDAPPAALLRDHPRLAAQLSEAWGDPLRRREVLKLLGASLALGGLSACTRQPPERIYPYARSPEALVPGKPLYFATAMPWPTGALGLLVESHMGRPTKVEGNPEHPASLGATDVFAQASILALYDPDRSRVVRMRERIRTFEAFQQALSEALKAQEPRSGEGLRILTETVTSPALAGVLRQALARLPRAQWIQYEPVHRDAARAGAQLAFGQDLVPRCRFDKARAIVSLDADFLGRGPASVLATRQLCDGRAAFGPAGQRLFVAEATPSITGAKADLRLPADPASLARIAGGIAAALGVRVEAAELPSEERTFVDAVAAELRAQRGASLVVAGEETAPDVQALAHALNQSLGNVGATVTWGEPVEPEPSDQARALARLVEEMGSGAVETLVILSGNPAYSAPADLDFAAALGQVAFSAHLSLHEDETSERCLWHLPEAHFLESWGDARAFDGSAAIVQPLIAPLYGGRSALEVAALLAGVALPRGHELVRAHWRTRLAGGLKDDADFERAWRGALHDGVVPGTSTPPVSASASATRIDLERAAEAGSGERVVFRADPAAWDGRFANSAWLQECPRPISKLVWDNAALIAPAQAARLSLASGDVVEVALEGRRIEAPVWIQPGQAEGCIALPLGYGRARAGSVGSRVGFDAGALRSSSRPWQAGGATLRKLDRAQRLVTTQAHPTMEGRDLLRVRRVGEETPARVSGDAGEPRSLMPPFPALTTNAPDPRAAGHAWGMSIDLDRCTGCNACLVACQAENNIPVVGKSECANGRELHWIRIDRYFEGDAARPQVHFQPVPCMHCEAAPCEVVCPVGATVHSDEGLNDMVYNRCIGTRYCANNCPYKVRRFNFLLYADLETPSLKLMRNPDVTVRTRGVMEKCTYCVQRISAARIQAKKEGRAVADGEAVTACQQVCPAQAIRFGDILDPASGVARAKARPDDYGLLTELNTRPRTTYLPKYVNPPPAPGSAEGR